jgi:hypothetical protein
LAKEESISFRQLQDYPCLSFDQGLHDHLYLCEEILPENDYSQIIKLNDRSTGPNLMIGLNGYMLCSFKKGTDIPNKTYINIKNAWLDFYLKDKNTIPFIFVNEFEIVEKPQENIQEKEQETVNEFSSMNIKTEYQEDEIKLTDEDLPF